MNLDEVTFADLFKKAGYATGCFEKWHNGSQYHLLPTLTDLAGISAKDAKKLDGISLKPLLNGAAENLPARLLFLSINKNNSVRKGHCLSQYG